MNRHDFCYCGRLLHFDNKGAEKHLKSIIDRYGYYMDIEEGKKIYRVPRTYIALHGIRGKDLNKLGFKEVIQMGGNKEGAAKAAATNMALYGNDFYKRIGHIGGSSPKTTPSGFAAIKWCDDKCPYDAIVGDHKKAQCAGYKGGQISRKSGPNLKSYRRGVS